MKINKQSDIKYLSELKDLNLNIVISEYDYNSIYEIYKFIPEYHTMLLRISLKKSKITLYTGNVSIGKDFDILG